MQAKDKEFLGPQIDAPPASIDIVVVFEPETEDPVPSSKRLLTEEGPGFIQKAAAARPRYPYGDDRDVLQHAELAAERRQQQEAATLQQLEAFRAMGARVVTVPAGKSEWLQFHIVQKEIAEMLRRRHSYERLKAHGKAARCPINPNAAQLAPEGFLAAYCPVCWTVDGALKDCTAAPEFQVEFRGERFFCCSEAHAELLLCKPEEYLRHRLPALLPRRLSPEEAADSTPMALKGFCPVTLVRTGELQHGDKGLLVLYDEQIFSFVSEDALSLFLLHPADYVSRACLPARLPASLRLGRAPRTLAGIAQEAHERCMRRAEAEGPPADPLMAEEGLAELRDQLKDALTYIEVSSLDLLIEALLFAGKSRPLHPQCGEPCSALRLVAHYLRAKNPLTKGHAKAEAETALDNFVRDCETPFEARKAILQLHAHLAEQGRPCLPAEALGALRGPQAEETQKGEWTHLSELRYSRVVTRLDSLFHLT